MVILQTIAVHCRTRLSVGMMLRWSIQRAKGHLDGQLTNKLEKHMIRKTITLCEGYQMMMRSSPKQVVPINPHIYSHCNPPTLHLAAHHHHHLRHPHHHHFDHLCGHSQMLLILFAVSHWLEPI